MQFSEFLPEVMRNIQNARRRYREEVQSEDGEVIPGESSRPVKHEKPRKIYRKKNESHDPLNRGKQKSI